MFKSNLDVVSCSSETAESRALSRCCEVLVLNVVCDCNVKAVDVPDRRNSRANLDKFVILECLPGSVWFTCRGQDVEILCVYLWVFARY